ncbi:MAG TPA: class II aldolase/adducin family protein [Candidatus Nanoarchaeia archaeon]|nr:class II aldolase/adducin family protein [Candidatus Nanoarchaeia archaeon]
MVKETKREIKNRKVLFVGGSYDDSGGKSSKIAEEIYERIDGRGVDYYNGGYFSELEKITNDVGEYRVVYWLAKTDSDKPRLVKKLKEINKELIVVGSKRNIDNELSFGEIVYDALSIKANLMVEFGQDGERYSSRVLDPLGNFYVDSEDMNLVGKVLRKRVDEILHYSRVGSMRIGEKIGSKGNEEFFELIRKYAAVFHDIIHPHADAVERFMGNASFRCEDGFPSYMEEDLIFVSKRNIDKREINSGGFVAVKKELPVKYYGSEKPSVDTPIQILLYQSYPKIRYMLHSHTYVKGAPFTERVIPCGAIEEFYEIREKFPNRGLGKLLINLRGHGSLVLSSEIEDMEDIDYIPRPIPEFQDLYLGGGGENEKN